MKKINLARIMSRLIKKFDLIQIGRQSFLLLSEAVIPITNIDALLKTSTVAGGGFDISAGGFVQLNPYCPKGKRWTLKAIEKGATTNAVTISMYDITSGNWISLFVATTNAHVENNLDIQMEENDSLYAFNGNVADNATPIFWIYEEEDAWD